MCEYLAASAPWLEFRETIFADYHNTFPATSVNTLMQVGHKPLRFLTMGMEDRQYARRTVDDIARDRACHPLDAVYDYLIADRSHTRILVTSMGGEDVCAIVRSPTVLIGSDSTALAPYGTTGQGKPHPRFYSTFPRVLSHYAREV